MSDSNAIHYDVWNPAGVDVTDRPSLTGAASDTVDAAGLLSSGIAQPESGMLFLAISDAGALAAQDIQSAWANEPEGGGAPSIDFVDLPAFLSQSDPANAGGWFPGPSVAGGSMPNVAFAAGHVSGAAMGPYDSQAGDGPGFLAAIQS
ncbi:MAG TPA: hypothetical protein VN702_16160 [Acetobacteraceae bacterium]|nr:hypothetical protein [Acetobacteraceae bacterium]